MARQILPIAGQIIGGMIGGPVGAAIGGALGSAIGQYVDPIRHQGPKLGEARAQTAQEGVYRPLVFGTGCVAGNVIHRSPRKVVVHREDASGKGNRDTVDSERGYRTFAIRIAEGPIAGLLRIWENETLVYDIRAESEIVAESLEYAEKFRFYNGDEDQLPDPDLEAYIGVGNVNSYRGTAYIVFGNFDLTDFGDMVPQFRFEVANGASEPLSFSYSGGNSFPASISLPTHAASAVIRLNFWTGAAPDKMIITEGVVEPIDTGYVGHPDRQESLNDALADMGLPPEPINTGTYSRLDPSIPEGVGYGAIVYVQKLYDVEAIPINVWAPQTRTAWSIVATIESGGGGSSPISLQSIILWLHRRVGQSLAIVDVNEIEDLVDGVVFADGYTARDAITALLPIYNADASEHDRGSGYRINYIKRGAPVVRTLTIDDLVDEPEETVREDPMERPRVLHMAFESPVTGYTAGKASIQRLSPDVKLVNEVSTYVPVTFKDVDEAWQKADVQMRVAWTEVHGERKFSIPDSHIDLVPTDNVALSLRGQVQRLRLQKNEYADGVMKLEAMADRQSNYTSHVTGIPLPAPEKPPPSLMGPAALAILDIPAISDQHDRLGYYVAVTGTADAFAGAVVQRQQNGAWSDVVSIGRSQRATMGVLENAVSAGSQHYTDTTNTISVTLYMDAELESLSNAQWLNKGGAFALETATGWEIMQYRDAYQDSGGVWHLTHLARGRLNTVPDEHLPGARFVMLSGAQFIDADVGMIGQPLTLRAAAVGRSPETAVPETITYQGNIQREFPVASLTAEVNGSDLDLSAIPRDRFGTEQHPVRSANHDGFRWAATDGSATVTADTDHATASLDVSGLSTPITVTVAQLNRFTGAGPTVSEQVE